MSYVERAGTPPRRIALRRMGASILAVIVAGLAAALGPQLLGPSSSGGPSRLPILHGIHVGRSDHHGGLGEADGAVPAGTTVFDDDVPGVAKLDPALLAALRRAAVDAQRVGIRFVVNSGWRSPAYEDQLRREAVAKYGSEAEAARWVATGTTSAHVSGDAVDLGPTAATAWLAARGPAYGLCRIYANEPWHFELRPEAAVRGCPAMYADAAHDPRMGRP